MKTGPEKTGPEPLMSAAQLAQALAIDRQTVYRLVRLGDLPDPVRVGSAMRWRWSDVEHWLNKKKTQAED